MTIRSLVRSPIRSVVRSLIDTMAGDSGPSTPQQTVVTAIIMGQSELEYFLNNGSFFNGVAAPTVTNANMTVILQDGDNAAIQVYEVTQANVNAGNVSYAMATLAEALAYVRPNTHFVIGDGAVPGTTRASLADDTTDATAGADGQRRYWADFQNVVDYIESNYGQVDHLIECWYNADANYVADMPTNFWPLYFGVDASGTTVNIGDAVAGGGGYQLDHMLWDYTAANNVKGRGTFRKDQTQWHILTPMPFCDGATTAPEDDNFTNGNRNEEPLRQNLHALTSDIYAQSVGLTVGPSTHITDFGGDIHPVVDDADGVQLFARQFLPALYRIGGITVLEPTITAVTGATDGSYADVEVLLPNGGTLTTHRQFRGLSLPASPSPHQQIVTGFEVFRTSQASRRPVFNTSETTYNQAFRGTVTIVDSGSGSPRKGKVRITPEIPYDFGDSVSYLRGQASALLQEDRDVPNKLFLDMLIEHIPTLYDASATYPYEGVAVRPLQSDILMPVTPPSFTARGAYFDGVNDGLINNAMSVANGGQGLISFWFKNDDSAWNQLKYIAQMRFGSTIGVNLRTASSGRLEFVIYSSGTAESKVFYADTSNTPMVIGQWYHVMISYETGSVVVYVNGSLALNTTTATVFTDTITQAAVSSEVVLRNQFTGDIAHFWFSTTQTLDIAQSANRDLFVNAGNPVDLGADGSTPTGTAPEFYFDGDGNAWNNIGTAGSLTLSGAIEASDTTPSY